MRKLLHHRRPTHRVAAGTPLMIQTEMVDEPPSWFAWFYMKLQSPRPPLVSSTSKQPIGPRTARPFVSSIACVVAHNQTRWMAIVVGLTPPKAVDPVVRWYSSQISRGVLRPELVIQLLDNPRCEHRFALVSSCLLQAKRAVYDGAHAMSMLLGLSSGQQRQLLCEYFINRPSPVLTALLPSAPKLLSEPSRMSNWSDALSAVTSLDTIDLVWQHPEVALRLIFCLSGAPVQCVAARSTMNDIISSAPSQHASAVCRQFCLEGRWLLALSCCRESNGLRDQLNIRARFEFGDWVGAIEAASVASDELRASAVQLLIRHEKTVLACTALRQVPLGDARLSPASTALLLAQLARRKRTHEETLWYRWVIDDMLQTLHNNDYVGNPAVDVAAAVALGACGSWERVLLLCSGHTANVSVVMTLLIAAAGGGAPWSIVYQQASKLLKVSSPTSKSTCEMLIRCALEAGAWRDAITMYSNHHHRFGVTADVLDHPLLVSKALNIRHSSSTYAFCGMWREALGAELRLGLVPSLQSAAGRLVASIADCWLTALVIANTTEERLRVAHNLLPTSLWASGIAILTAAIGTESSVTRSLVLQSAARALSAATPEASLDLLAAQCTDCLGSKGRAALLLQTVLRCPSNRAMSALVPWLSWSDAMKCLQHHRERPTTPTFLKCLVDYHQHQAARQTKLMIVLRLLSTRRGRRVPTDRSFTVLFEAQSSRAVATLTSAESLDVHDESSSGLPRDVDTKTADQQTWWTAMALLSHPISSVTKRPWQHLGDCPDDILVNAVLKRRPPQEPASTCLTTLADRGRWELAVRVMEALSKNRTFPEMESLVDLVESAARTSTDVPLRHCVDAVRRYTPLPVFNSVLRAVAERSAAEHGGTWNGALQVLATVALAGVTHIPPSVVQRIAQLAPAKAARVAMDLLDARSYAGSTPMALDVASIAHVVAAATSAKLEPTVDVFELRHGVFAGAISSSTTYAFDGSANKVIKRLATLPMPSLWYIALSLCSSKGDEVITKRNVNRAYILAASGCSDGATLEALADSMKRAHMHGQSLLGPRSALMTDEQQRSVMHASHFHPLTTCAVSCTLATRFGKWDRALQMLSSDDVMTRTAKVAITHCSGLFDDVLKETLMAYRAELKRQVNVSREHRRLLTCSGELTDTNPLWWLL